MDRNETTQWRYTASSQEVVRTDGVLIAREVPPEFGPMLEAAPELLVALQRLHIEAWHMCRQLEARGLPGVKGDTVDRVMAEAKAAIARARAHAAHAPVRNPIKSAPKDGSKIDLWLVIYASPRSMGWGDKFWVTDCWWTGKEWAHRHHGKDEGLYCDYVAAWLPSGSPKPEGDDIQTPSP